MVWAVYFCFVTREKTIWWLAGWFPTDLDPQGGNFIVRHAQAILEYQRLQVSPFRLKVFHFPVYKLGRDAKPQSVVALDHADIVQVAVAQLPWGGWICRSLNYYYYRWVAGRRLRKAITEDGLPNGLHIHAGDKVARLVPGLYHAFRSQGKGAIPLWYTEHWAIFNEVVSDGFGKRGRVFRRDYLRLWERVTVAAPVSLDSQKSMQAYLGGAKPFVLFRNVVDPAVFKPAEVLSSETDESVELPFAFLHVSSLEPRKNILGMLRAFAALRQKHPDWKMQFRIVGGVNERYLSEARTAALGLGLLHIFQPSVAFFGPRDPHDVAFQMQNADVFVLFSEMENAPCVIAEAHCVGLPVIASSVAGIPEMISAQNGILVTRGDEAALTLAMESAYLNHQSWNRSAISQEALVKYQPQSVATALDLSYRSLIDSCAE